MTQVWLVRLIFFWYRTWHPLDFLERLGWRSTEMRILSGRPGCRHKHDAQVFLCVVKDTVVTRRHFSLKKSPAFNTGKCTPIRSSSAKPVAVPYGPSVGNDCHCCAERKLIRSLQLQASRQGVGPARFSAWIHRKYGDFIVTRVRVDGGHGTSLPCVICRKALERYSIQWRAHIGSQWVKSTDPDVPPSRSTTKQRIKLGFL